MGKKQRDPVVVESIRSFTDGLRGFTLDALPNIKEGRHQKKQFVIFKRVPFKKYFN